MNLDIPYPLFKVHVNKHAALENLARVFDSGFINEGTEVKELQEALKPILGSEQIILMNSCTSALTVALRLAGVKPGKNVVSSPMTCIASNTPIINLSGEIKWADVSVATGMPTPEMIERQIDEHTVAVLFVDWAGIPPQLDEIYALCQRRGVALIQDAAHAFMAEFNDQPITRYADFTCFSFQAIKHFTCGDGGALVCRDPLHYQQANKLKWFGYDREQSKDEKGNWKAQQAEVDIDHNQVGYKFNMNNVAAAIGLANLAKMPELLTRHRANAAIYDEYLAKTGLAQPLSRPENCLPSFWVYTLVLQETRIDRDTLCDALLKEGIHAGQVHVPNDDYKCFERFKIPLPGVRAFSAQQLALPCGWWISEKQAHFIGQTFLSHLLAMANALEQPHLTDSTHTR